MRETHATTRPVLYLARLTLVLATAACAARRSAGGARDINAERPSPPFRLETVLWSEPYAGPLGFPKGAQRASLGIDPRTGGETYYARFPAGTSFELHWHTYAEYAVVLRGKVTHTLATERYVLQPGDYVVIPPRVNHGWTVDSGADAFLLIRRDGPADFNFVAK
jgi:quercetin dioxygenase-like cupin family protein